MVYGDSVSRHYYALGQLMPLCKEIFKRCKKAYMWIYDVSTDINNISNHVKIGPFNSD